MSYRGPMSPYLNFYGGRQAISVINDQGLSPQSVRVVAGAAGGPKWLVLGSMDKMLFSTWFAGRSKPLFLLGSSAGSWRFAAAAQKNPGQALERLRQAYIEQWYSSRPSPRDITRECNRIFRRFLDPDGVAQILGNPVLRLNILAVRSLGPVGSETRSVQAAGLVAAAMANAVKRDLLKFFFHRVLFYQSKDRPPFFGMNRFPIHHVPLSEANIQKALLASGSIPYVMEGVTGIPQAPPGVYRDGGALDYHLDIPFLENDLQGVVLFPHYTDRIIPGWLDKSLTRRLPGKANMDPVLMICPSKKFLDLLPGKKIPDRNDFQTFKGNNAERIRRWNKACGISDLLAEELYNTLDSGRLREVVRPLPSA
ncbi:MAG: patatin-like phospholipase family protein [Pseudomonadota bacterium]